MDYLQVSRLNTAIKFLFYMGYVIGSVMAIPPLSKTTLKATEGRVSEFKGATLATLFAGDYVMGITELQGGTEAEAFQAEISTLKDHMSILERVSILQGSSFKVPSEHDSFQPPLCKRGSDSLAANSSLSSRNRVVSSIQRALNFFESHLDHLDTIEPAFGLVALKVVDDKHGSELQKKYPLSEWISRVCSTLSDNKEAETCNAMTKIWKSRPALSWKSESIIQEYASEVKQVGSEKEVIWGKLNGECQVALLTRCEVPYVCERTLFDPIPRSQYMLTHQLLQRTFAELGNCPSTKNLIDSETNHRICAKIYKEAQLIDVVKTPAVFRDLFTEQIGLCGYMGYPNFLRQDWLDLVLSWQSKSDYGCFVRDREGMSKFMSTDIPVKRLTTKTEKMEGREADEDCLPHFTSVSLVALASYWDYIEENCV